MIFENGFPRVTYADDFCDSNTINFWMIVTKHPQACDPVRYYTNKGPVRYPFGKTTFTEDKPRCLSRDALFVLIASEYFYHGKSLWKPKWFAPNNLSDTGKWKLPDPMFLPHQMNHQKICHNQTYTLSGLSWLVKDIDYNAKHTPLREPNQLLAMCLTANKLLNVTDIIQYYCHETPQWRDALKLYWNDDRPNHYNRGEPELYEAIVKYIESYL